MDAKKLKNIKKISNNLSEELFIQHNITDLKTKRIIKDYYYDIVYKKELAKEIQAD